MSARCRCCERKVKPGKPRQCPECGRIFKGKSWEGIDAHWKAKHEDVMSYQDFLQGLCPDHRGA
jgi:hypothetical protein